MVLKVGFQTLLSKMFKYQKYVTPPLPPISLVRRQNTFLPRLNHWVFKISRLPFTILQRLIVVVSEWRKRKLR